MKSFNEICAEVGYNPNATCPIVSQEVWFAYKNGEVKQFSTREEAVKFSKNVEKSITNLKEINEWKEAKRELRLKTVDVWLTLLKLEYNDLPSKIFDLCYSRARDRSSGFDEIAFYMQDEVEFVEQVIEILKNT